MKIDIKAMSVVPMMIMFIFATHISIAFNAVEWSLASYMSLGLTLLAFLLSIVLTIRSGCVPRLFFFTFFFLLLVEVVSLTTSVEWKQWLYIGIDVALLMLMFHYYQANLKYLLIGLLIGFSISMYAQLYQCITNPDLWLFAEEKTNTGYLLGDNYNAVGCRIIVTLLTGILSIKISKWWWLNLIPLIAAALGFLFMVRSMTALTCVILLLVLCLVPNKKLQRRACYGIFVAVILFEVLVCFQGKGFENNELARWFLIDVLGKDVTFTGRTNLWDAAMRILAESPLWGYGYPSADWFYSNMSSQAMGSHNFILGILINGGIIGLLLFGYTFYLAFSKLLLSKDYYSNVILITMAAFSVMMLMEYYPVDFSFYIFTLAYYYKQIDYATTKQKADE